MIPRGRSDIKGISGTRDGQWKDREGRWNFTWKDQKGGWIADRRRGSIDGKPRVRSGYVNLITELIILSLIPEAIGRYWS